MSFEAQSLAFKKKLASQPIYSGPIIPPSAQDAQLEDAPVYQTKRAAIVYSQPTDTGIGENVMTRLVRIVEHLKSSHRPLSLTEIQNAVGINLRSDLELERAVRSNQRIKIAKDGKGEEVYSFKRTYNISDKQSLLVHLRTYVTGGATDAKLLRDDWAQVDGAIERLAREGRIGLIRNKDGSPRVVFYDELGDQEAVRAEASGQDAVSSKKVLDDRFLKLWNDTVLPNETDLPRELSQAGLTSLSGQVVEKTEGSKMPIKKKKGAGHRKIKITNTHLSHIDLSRDYLPQS